MSSSFQSTSEVIPPRDLFRDMITPTRGWTPTGLKKPLEPPHPYYPTRGLNLIQSQSTTTSIQDTGITPSGGLNLHLWKDQG